MTTFCISFTELREVRGEQVPVAILRLGNGGPLLVYPAEPVEVAQAMAEGRHGKWLVEAMSEEVVENERLIVARVLGQFSERVWLHFRRSSAVRDGIVARSAMGLRGISFVPYAHGVMPEHGSRWQCCPGSVIGVSASGHNILIAAHLEEQL